jgi:hypothetical protein
MTNASGAKGQEWSNFDQQVGQVPLLYMLVMWPTCPLNIPNDIHGRGSAFIVRRCKRSKTGAGLGPHAPLVLAGDAN